MFKDFFEKLGKNLQKFFKNRTLVLGVVLAILGGIVIVRLFDLQLIKGNDYLEKYMNTTKKEVSIPAMRGNIYDRKGKLLAGNRVVYNVTVSDENQYTKGNGDFNEMLLRLIVLMEKYNVETVKSLPVTIGSDGKFAYDGSESKVRRFIRDVYSADYIEEQAEKDVDVYAFDAEKVMGYLMKNLYNFSSKWKGAADVSKEHALKICNIRYSLAATAFTRYISTVVAADVGQNVQAAVLESRGELLGVAVEETYERDYKDSECFSSVLGYVGSITTEEIEELNASGGNYIAGDVIGKEGIESAYESYLQGTKGKKLIYVNSTGMVLHEEILEEPTQGNDVYLSIDADMTVAVYNIIEQQLAGVIVAHLYNGTDYDPMVAYEKSEYLIPIRDVYFQMINNNILSMKDFSAEKAGTMEKRLDRKRADRKKAVIERLKRYLENSETGKVSEEDEYMQQYIRYFYTFLSEEGYLLGSEIDTSDEHFVAWKEGECGFPEFIKYALGAGWVDMQKIGDKDRYNSVDSCYAFLTDYAIDGISRDYGEFDKLIYDELIHRDEILGTEIGMILFDQEILAKDEEAYETLKNGNNDTAFEFFREKITSMELTPSQIALDPCSAGLCLTDPTTGSLLACVTYPGYDSNQINNNAYYMKLLTDQSSPLYSRATQSRLAPGSTFKMITSIAALEGGYFKMDETYRCEGIFDKLDHPRCWIYRLQNGAHGNVDVVGAIGNSCNCFFYECGYRFSMNAKGQYSPSTGIGVLNHYAEMFGFGTLTGIETSENVSVLTNELPITSSIGQGTYAFTTISLARYVTAIASSGDVYEFKFLNHIEDRNGKVLLEYTPVVKNHLNFSESTWQRIHLGMYTVVHEGGSRNGDFASLRYNYASKSGSAQENRLRAEHGWYVTYGPYDNIQYSMAIQIPNGYSSGNAALIANSVYEFLEGDVSLEEILKNSASRSDVNNVLD